MGMFVRLKFSHRHAYGLETSTTTKVETSVALITGRRQLKRIQVMGGTGTPPRDALPLQLCQGKYPFNYRKGDAMNQMYEILRLLLC